LRSPIARTAIRILAILLCAGSMWISHHLALKHVKQIAAPPAQAAATQPATQVAAEKDLGILGEPCAAIIETADCDKVMASDWGEITFAGIRFPTALLGLYYYTALFVWFVLVGPVTTSRAWIHVLLACFMAVGLGMSGLLMYEMTRLPELCDLCIVTHVANLLVFICVLLLWPRKPRTVPGPVVVQPATAPSTSLFAPLADPPGTSRDWPHWWMLAVTPVVILLVMWVQTLSLASYTRGDPRAVQQLQGKLEETESRLGLVGKERDLYRSMSEQHEASAEIEEFRTRMSQEIEQLEAKVRNTEQVRDYWKKHFERYNTKWRHTYLAWQLNPPVNFSPSDRVRGPANARHTVTIFSDFECPTCRDFEHAFTQRIVPMAAQHGGLRVVFKHWPISTGCNPHAVRDLHPAACAASLAAEAAMMVGGVEAFWKMHDLLFERQHEWKTSPAFDNYARQIGLDVEAFQAAMKSDEAMRRILADVEEGAALGKDLVDAGHLDESEREFLKVDSTPSVYFNNKKMVTLHHIHTWQSIMAQPPPQAAAPGAAPRPAAPGN
jgi:uncharacterized membrane protein